MSGLPAVRSPWRSAMRPHRDDGPERAATPLEAFFDLCFVVAVAQAGTQLHHALAEGHAAAALLGYLTVFFAIWWAWVNFTWFASAYDTDDVPYRLATFVQITGVLILAAGVPRAFTGHDFGVVVVGYAVMRTGLISQWLRAAAGDPAGRTAALRYAGGVALVEVGWVSWLAVPPGGRWLVYGLLVVTELAVPALAERDHPTAWHPGHIAERYGLFTLIVLGESVAAATIAVQTALDDHEATARLYTVTAGGLVAVFAMWWLYFSKPAARLLTSSRVAFAWGYGHYVILSSAAAVGAGLAVNLDRVTHHSEVSRAWAGACVTIPVALFLMSVWALHVRPHPGRATHLPLYLGAILATLAATFTPVPVLVAGLVPAALVAASVILADREPAA
ncbi:MAG: low temperature requirement protein A [Frankia sp.]